MSAFMINTNVVAKVVTAILLNFDTFDGKSTARGALLAAPTDAQKEAGTNIGKKFFILNRRALRARYGRGDHLRCPEFVFEIVADPDRSRLGERSDQGDGAVEHQLDIGGGHLTPAYSSSLAAA